MQPRRGLLYIQQMHRCSRPLLVIVIALTSILFMNLYRSNLLFSIIRPVTHADAQSFTDVVEQVEAGEYFLSQTQIQHTFLQALFVYGSPRPTLTYYTTFYHQSFPPNHCMVVYAMLFSAQTLHFTTTKTGHLFSKCYQKVPTASLQYILSPGQQWVYFPNGVM